MKNFKQLLHIWITTVSMIAFLGGWGLLAHSPNTASRVATAAATTAQTSAVTTTSQAGSSLFSVSPSNQSSRTTTFRTSGS